MMGRHLLVVLGVYAFVGVACNAVLGGGSESARCGVLPCPALTYMDFEACTCRIDQDARSAYCASLACGANTTADRDACACVVDPPAPIDASAFCFLKPFCRPGFVVDESTCRCAEADASVDASAD